MKRDKYDSLRFARFGFCTWVSVRRYCTRVATGEDRLCTFHRNAYHRLGGGPK